MYLYQEQDFEEKKTSIVFSSVQRALAENSEIRAYITSHQH
jgi:hypothetical protein